ncbi:MAG: sulfite exporter TauE/SafE family protein [Candidatus Aureabacteria bacterium]|nr:sulfite exporter TauE/SafE family protein [Candidatus Auribacterota bacterium]
MSHPAIGIFLGFIAGIASGFLGIGGGAIVIPALVLILGFSQHQAQGTTLAMLVPPIGLLAAFSYYREGYVHLKLAAFLCLGFFFGGFFGAKMANIVSDALLRKCFGLFLLVLSLKLIFQK